MTGDGVREPLQVKGRVLHGVQARRRLAFPSIDACVIALVVGVMFLVPLRGSIPALVMVVTSGLGITNLARSSTGLFPQGSALRRVAVLLGVIVAWQGLGFLVRRPFDTTDLNALGSTVTIGCLFVVLTSAHRDERFLNRLVMLIFGVGAVSAMVSIALHLAAIAHTDDVMGELLARRLVPFGRAQHPIIGAGGLAAAFVAGVALGRAWKGQDRHWPRGLLPLGLVTIAVALVLTQSRGPILALALACGSLFVLDRVTARWRRTAAILLSLTCFLLPAILVVAEPQIVHLLCSPGIGLCRPSMRQDVWHHVLQMIPDRPFFGVGPSYRFPDVLVSHAHNGLIGTMFVFGVPMGFLFVACIVLALRVAAPLAREPARDFAIAGLFFASGFLATDLANPFAFLNTHYLFLWLPLFAAVLRSPPETEAAGLGRDGSGRQGCRNPAPA